MMVCSQCNGKKAIFPIGGESGELVDETGVTIANQNQSPITCTQCRGTGVQTDGGA